MYKYIITFGFIILSSISVSAQIVIQELVPWDTIDGGVGSFKIQGHVFEGQHVWVSLSGIDKSQFVKIENVNGAQTRVPLVTAAQWLAASGKSGMNGSYGMGIVGSDVQMAETNSRQIWRIDKNTGLMTVYVDNATITAAAGQPPSFTSASAVHPNTAEHAFYETRSDNIFITTGSNAITALVTAQALSNAFGNSKVSGGMTFDPAGNLYWGNYLIDCLCMRTSNGTVTTALTTSEIEAVTGTNLASFGSIKYFPDGHIYFVERRSGSILRFRPAIPADSLEIYVTREQLTNGPGATANLGALGWYNNRLTYNNENNESDSDGIYIVIPEPASMLTLLIAGLIFRRKYI
jgi:hypothetical protein